MNRKPIKNTYLKEPSIMKKNKTNKQKKIELRENSVKIRQFQKPIIFSET